VNAETWQRFRNLVLFKVWMTDRQLKKFWPVVALIAVTMVAIAAIRYFLH
jgi:hypothetical protein